MAIDAQWIPIISESISWVSNKLGPSNKKLNMRISDLEQQVQLLTAENGVLMSNLSLIIQAILNQLQASNNFIINADAIYLVGENAGTIKTETSFIVAEENFRVAGQGKQKGGKLDVSKIFDRVDEEIAHTRVSRPCDWK